MQTWEHYERSIDPEGGSAEFSIDLKWSLWSADEGYWAEYAPDVLSHLRDMYNNVVIITTAPRKEIRWGRVVITGTSECGDAPGYFKASVRFEEHWDDDEAMDGEPGVMIEAEIEATSVAELLLKIDAVEDELLKN